MPLAIIYCYYCRFLHIQPHCVSQAIDEDDVDALFDSNQVRPEARSGRGIRNLNPAAEPRVGCRHSLVSHARERAGARARPPLGQREKLEECLSPTSLSSLEIRGGTRGWLSSSNSLPLPTPPRRSARRRPRWPRQADRARAAASFLSVSFSAFRHHLLSLLLLSACPAILFSLAFGKGV